MSEYQNKNFSNMFESFFKTNPMNFDQESLLSTHKKNIKALSEAGKSASEVVQKISTLQTEYIKDAFENIELFIEGIFKSFSKGELAQVNPNFFKDVIAKSVNHSADVMNVVGKSNKNIYETFQDSYNDGSSSSKKDN